MPRRTFPAKDHIEAFYRVLNNNINITIHAGEAFGAPSIHQALHYCGAHRIGHGTHLNEDVALMNWVNDHRIPVEVCLASNLQTKAIPDYQSHPIRLFMEKGLRVTLNTDNRLVSGTTVTNEYRLAVENYDLSEDQVLGLVMNGFKSAFLPLKEKALLIDQVLDEFASLGASFSGEISRRRRITPLITAARASQPAGKRPPPPRGSRWCTSVSRVRNCPDHPLAATSVPRNRTQAATATAGRKTGPVASASNPGHDEGPSGQHPQNHRQQQGPTGSQGRGQGAVASGQVIFHLVDLGGRVEGSEEQAESRPPARSGPPLKTVVN